MNACAKTLTVIAVAYLLTASVTGQSEETRRTDVGIRMFATLLGADLDLQKKSENGKLLLVIFYTTDANRAERLAAGLRVMPNGEPKMIGGLPVEVLTTTDPGLAAFANRKPAGIFVGQSPDGRNLRTLIQYGIAQRVIVYSPFEGHVESGVHGGLSIGAQVKPYVNRATLEASRITLKDLFMKVTKVYQ